MGRYSALCLFCVSLWAQDSGFTLPKPGFNLFSKAQDVQLGQEAAAQIETKAHLLRDPRVSEYINRIGQSLTRLPEADGADFHYTFKVIEDKDINAFSLPGGPVYVNTGLIAFTDNEAQLAGATAHEISHVALRHGTNQASKADFVQLVAVIGGSFLGNSGSLLGELGKAGIGLGADSALLKFSRTDESQADALGARLMYEAGYNPMELAKFFENLEARSGNGIQFLSDHPNPGNRVKAIEDEIRTFPQRRYTTDARQFRKIEAIVSRLPK